LQAALGSQPLCGQKENSDLTIGGEFMFIRLRKRNQLKQCFRKQEFARHGLSAEFIGTHTIKIRREGSYLGQLRQTVGSYRWYPAGSNEPKFRVFSPEDALTRIIGAF
jgi:hypothetical protein